MHGASFGCLFDLLPGRREWIEAWDVLRGILAGKEEREKGKEEGAHIFYQDLGGFEGFTDGFKPGFGWI